MFYLITKLTQHSSTIDDQVHRMFKIWSVMYWAKNDKNPSKSFTWNGYKKFKTEPDWTNSDKKKFTQNILIKGEKSEKKIHEKLTSFVDLNQWLNPFMLVFHRDTPFMLHWEKSEWHDKKSWLSSTKHTE